MGNQETSVYASTVIEQAGFLTCKYFFYPFKLFVFIISLLIEHNKSYFNMSAIRQNYNEESEAAINKQINMELYASYVYMSMAYHFDRDDVALEGFHKFFKNQSDDEREHAQKLMKYQNMRGGRIVLRDVAAPPTLE